MKKIGILTFHDGPNHGAFLQAFALMKFIEKQGYDVEVINYKNKQHIWFEEVKPLFDIGMIRRPIRFVDFFSKKKVFEEAQQELTIKNDRITSLEELKKHEYDVVVVGSDVVWNYKIFGLDDAFYGDLNAKKIISYAPSFGWVTYGEKLLPGIKEKLERFKRISVRDVNSQKIVNKLLGYNPQVVLDPTLIFDFDSYEKPYKKKYDKYMVVYCYIASKETVAYIKKMAKDLNLRIIAAGYRQRWCDEVITDCGPFDWLTLFKEAEMVITSTFHGSIFALKYRQKFYYIANEKARNRVASLLGLFGIEKDLDVPDGQLIEIDPDYDQAFENAKPLIAESQEWLLNSLK